MNKLKKFWKENRILSVLIGIVLVCIIIIGIIMVQNFVGSKGSKYGNRLVDIEKNQFSATEKDKISNSYKEMEQVDTVTIDVRGKVIYVIVQFKTGATLAEAQSKSNDIYNSIEEQYRKLYDYNVTLKQNDEGETKGFLTMGARNMNGSAFIWSNNTPFETSEE